MDSFPIAIGGLGGSGTRVFAEILRHAGFHLGEQLNASLDNLWFSILFKRRAWSRRTPDPGEISVATDLFVRAMTRGLAGSLAPDERALIAGLRADLPPMGPWQCGVRVSDANTLVASGPQPGGAGLPWAWKEPNTHVFLPHLDRRIAGFRYVHVVRDGLDMAFSANTWQARHWSHLYGLAQDVPLPLHQLRFWTAANRAALDHGARHMPGRFLAVRFEDLCDDPQGQWHRILRFLGLDDSRAFPVDLVKPSGIGRSAGHDLSLFPAADLEAARALQSEVALAGGLG